MAVARGRDPGPRRAAPLGPSGGPFPKAMPDQTRGGITALIQRQRGMTGHGREAPESGTPPPRCDRRDRKARRPSSGRGIRLRRTAARPRNPEPAAPAAERNAASPLPGTARAGSSSRTKHRHLARMPRPPEVKGFSRLGAGQRGNRSRAEAGTEGARGGGPDMRYPAGRAYPSQGTRPGESSSGSADAASQRGPPSAKGPRHSFLSSNSRKKASTEMAYYSSHGGVMMAGSCRYEVWPMAMSTTGTWLSGPPARNLPFHHQTLGAVRP